MSKVFFPNSTQFDEMNRHLADIVAAIASGSQMDLSTWEGVQRAVRLGLAPKLFPIGTQLVVTRTEGDTESEYLFDVVAHDYYKSVHDETAHTMTLLCHTSVGSIQFDAPEAFYYAKTELPAGTYNFTIPADNSAWLAGTYNFTLTKAIPAGGQLCISAGAGTPMTSCYVVAYGSASSTVDQDYVSIVAGKIGTSLGTFGVELNHTSRVAYGSNNYKESVIRQFLNNPSSGGGLTWLPQTKFDRIPSWVEHTVGFTAGLGADFLSVVGEVVVPCSANNIYESPDSTVTKGTKYTVTDKFYLASQMEIFGDSNGSVVDGSALFPYYKGADAADRVKGVPAQIWWTRTPRDSGHSSVVYVSAAGGLSTIGAATAYGVVPACTIV